MPLVGYHSCFFAFIYMIPIACEVANVSLYLFANFFENIF